MSNELNYGFGAFPERLFVLIDGVVVFEGGPTPILYSIGELEKWIKNWVSKTKD